MLTVKLCYRIQAKSNIIFKPKISSTEKSGLIDVLLDIIKFINNQTLTDK